MTELSIIRGGVPTFLQKRRQRGAARLDDERRVAGQDAGAPFSPRILASQQAVTRRRAGRGCAVGIRETESFICELVDVRRHHLRRAVATDIAITKVVGVDKHDVGTIRRGQRGCSEKRKQMSKAVHRLYRTQLREAKQSCLEEARTAMSARCSVKILGNTRTRLSALRR